ncbi:dihydrolipoamide acetyltransferase family protein [Kordiimonas lacus]|uniref:Dihydrolipoamide acetyltransferase component of pyruvate dehydrogenase complex n=1 Tax=Kordiimonas lacus TaxID=637679 RepID=A0A1G7CJG1_9PROT|nr:dihydrolipoamide acetyltransferase family protein [Kordiimonas lacus]SDE39498.1 2-oxoisovalerate dehydrogenase E2 component (dihydrolipoyl transacylase) [Kordiimonas lacus]
MGIHKIQMPDVGEGITEAEIVEWNVKVGDVVKEDDVIAAVMTDKATVEIPSPVDGTVTEILGEIGSMTPVGSVIIALEVEGEGNNIPDAPVAEPEPAPEAEAPKEPSDEAPKAAAAASSGASAPKLAASAPKAKAPAKAGPSGAPRAEGEKPLASPAVRKRAMDAGVKLQYVHGTGPAGRITHEDLEDYISGASAPAGGSSRRADTSVEEIKVIGLRRKIGERMQDAKSRIPHITYVEEVDVTELESLREHMNATRKADQPKLTILPFIMLAMVKSLKVYPKCSAHYYDADGVVHQFGAAHIGMAAQTPGGLMVPVLKHAEAMDIWGIANETRRLAEAARDGSITREELTGSTITLSSLGRMGGIVSTPVINSPEVAIVGVNKVAVRPVWKDGGFAPRKIMNLSSSFDHRIIDGWDAAEFIQKIRELMENPATLFMED